MNVNDQHFRSVGTFDTLHPVGQESRQHWTIGYLPYLRAWYPRYQRQIMDVHEKTLWSSIPHVFDTLSTIHTTEGQEISIGRVGHKRFLSWLLYKPPPPPRWTGMIAELRSQKADMAVIDMSVTSIRQTAVDFTMPFMSTGVRWRRQRHTVKNKLPPSTEKKELKERLKKKQKWQHCPIARHIWSWSVAGGDPLQEEDSTAPQPIFLPPTTFYRGNQRSSEVIRAKVITSFPKVRFCHPSLLS